MANRDFKNLKLKQIDESIKNHLPIPAEKIGQRLKDIRTLLGMTQKQIARKLGVKQPVISRIEENSSASSIDTLQKIANALGVELVFSVASDLSLHDRIHSQAGKVAERILKRTYANMAMEKQAVKRNNYEEQKESLIKQIIEEPKSMLWEE